MAEIKFTQLPVGATLVGPEIFAMVQGGVSVSTTADDIANFVADIAVNYGDGIAYDSGTNTVSADINTTNLQFTANQINTIQDIDVTAIPDFQSAILTSTTAGFLMPRMTSVQFDNIALPENGLVAWSQSTNRFRVNNASPGAPVYKELAYFDDLPADSTAFGEIFFQGNAVETVIAGIGVAAKVDGVYNAGDLLNFTNGSGLLTYTGTDTKQFALNLSLTTTLNLMAADISVILYKNGSPIAKSEQTSFTGSTTPGLQNGSVNALIELATNDIIEVFVINNDSTDNITVQDLNLNVSTIGGAVGNLADQVVTSWDGSTSPVGVTAGTDIDITGGIISYVGTSGDNVVTAWDGSATPVAVTATGLMDITGGVVSTTAEVNVVSTWEGSATPLAVTAGTNISLFGGVVSTSAEPNVVTAWDGSATPLAITSGTGIDITAGVISATGGGGTGNTTLGTVTVPTTNYPLGLSSVWSTLSGTNTIVAGTFNIGDTIEVDVLGQILLSGSSPTLVSPSFMHTKFGALIDGVSNNVNVTSFPSSFSGAFKFKTKFTRVNSNTINFIGSGFFEDIGGTMRIIRFQPLSTSSYNDAVNYDLDVEFNKQYDSTNTYDYIFWGMNIKQYS